MFRRLEEANGHLACLAITRVLPVTAGVSLYIEVRYATRWYSEAYRIKG